MQRFLFLLAPLFFACTPAESDTDESDEAVINDRLDQWHQDAAAAHFEPYFSLFSDQGVFVGTDPSEIWTVEAFQSFAKPYFDEGNTWSFTTKDRTIQFSNAENVAWFHELLDTWMGTCRGSGVFQKSNGEWKLEQYVLSLTVPNEKMDSVMTVIN